MFSQLLYGNGGNTNHPHHSPTPQQQSQPAQPQQSHHATADGTHLFALDNSHPHHQLLSQALSLQEQQQHVMNLMLQSYALSGHHLPHPHAHHSPHHPHAHHPHSHHSSSPHSNDGSPVNNSTSPSSSSQPFLPSLVHTLPEHKTSTAVDTTSAATSPSNNSSNNNSSHNSNSSSILVLSDEDVEFLSQSHAPDYVNDRSHPSTAAASAATTTSMDGIVSQCVPQQYHQATNHQRSPHSQPLTNSNEPFNSATPGIIHEQFNFDTVPNNFLSVIQEKQRILQKREEMQEEHQAAQKQRDSRKSSSSSSSGSERMASPESSSQSSYGGDSPQRSNTPLQESSPSKAPANRKRSRAQVESDQVELEKLLTVPEKERTEQQKKTILKLRNRQTAKRSRDRKKLEFEATIEENKKLVQSNKQLADQVKKLKNENEELKRTVDLLTKGHHGAMAAAALHHHHHQQQQQQQRPAYLTPQGNMVDSPDSFVTLTVADDNVPHQEDDIEQMMNGEFDYLNHTDPMGQPKGFQAFSPLFTFQNESTNHPNKKSKMFMLVFFVACICCFFIGTTLVNELPSHAILMNANKSSPKRHKEVRLLNTHLYKHTYIPQNPSTSFDDAIKNIITQHQDLQQSSSALPATNVASTTTVKTLSESASSNTKQAPVAIEVVEEVVEELVEEIVEVKDDEEVDIKDQLEISNNHKNNMMSNVDVHVNPDLNQWLQEQLKVSSSDSVPVMVKFDINDKTSAFILTSMDKNFTEEQQKLFVSQYKTSLISDMRGVCPRPLKLIQ